MLLVVVVVVVVVVETVKTGKGWQVVLVPRGRLDCYLELAVAGVALVEKHEVRGRYYCQHFQVPC
jgi:hypothetical protein